MNEREIFAKLADASYGKAHEDSIPPDWSLIIRDYNGDGTTENDEGYKETISGFAAAAYRSGNEIIISYRGTNNINDWVTGNAGILLDKIMEQYSEALTFYYTIRDENPNAIISFTGHSLGGALSQLMGAYCETSQFDKAYYGKSYAFNAPGVSHLLNNLGISQQNFSSIHNYINMSDLVGNLFNISLFGFTIGNHLGSTEFLNPTSEINPENQAIDIFRSHGIYGTDPLSDPPSWTGIDGLSLWLFDSVNNLSELNTVWSSQVNESTFKTAFEKIFAMGTPKETLSYTISTGKYILGDGKDNNVLEGKEIYNAQGLVDSNYSDQIWGNEGDDSINGLGGNDYLYGGHGNDTINGGDNDDIIYGDDTITLMNTSVTYNDLIIGGTGSDEIYGGQGNDTIFGNDATVSSGDGKNKLYGDGGDDKIIAGDNNDFIDGGSGDDTIVAGQGNDMIIGGTGDDHIYSGTGKSMLAGGEGNDTYHINMINGLSGSDFTGRDGIVFQTIDKTTIIDSDGVGSVIANGITLTGGKATDSTNIIKGIFSRLIIVKVA